MVSRKSKGLFARVYAPLDHLLQATRNVSSSAFQRSGRIVREGVGFASNTGRALSGHANMAVRNVISRRNRNRSRRNRRNRRNTRRNTRRNV